MLTMLLRLISSYSLTYHEPLQLSTVSKEKVLVLLKQYFW